MTLFKVVKKTHEEKPGEDHRFKVALKSEGGDSLTLKVSELEFEQYRFGLPVDVVWMGYQKRLDEVMHK